MDAELKAAWVKALRSGEYQQAQNFLFNGEGYCCLGVLEICRGSSNSQILNRCFSGASDDGLMSRAQEQTLIMMNDIEAKSFREVADYIEREL